jgi:hypothetical protein
MKKKEFLTEAKRKAIIADKEKAILESFAKTFNKIKRIDENTINEFEEENSLYSRQQEFGINPEIEPEEFNQEDELTEYGLAGMPKNKAGGDSPYFETLSQALDVVREYATKLGYEVDEDDMWFQFGTGGVGYEETKSANIGLLKNGEPILDKRGKQMNRFIRVSIYRMPFGKYELTMYKTF